MDMKQTAMQQHIEWLTATIEIAEQQAPILVNALNLCLNDAKQKLIMEKEQIIKCYCDGFYKSGEGWNGEFGLKDVLNISNEIKAEQYYNENFKSE